ncbi:MAG: outer membrane protein transport protein [Chromatiales bacterium]|jgi:long-chain fatty acid transport protein
MKHHKKLLAVLITGALASSSVFATNGYAPHGIGMKSKGMGGVNIAYQADAVAVGGNPAGSAFLDDRLDIGVDLFRPQREASITGNSFTVDTPMGPFPASFDGNFDGNGTDLFLIPEFGYRRGLNDQIAFALSMFGNGGMNTDYKDGVPIFNVDQTFQSNRTGINLSQLFIVPSMSYKLNSNNSIGIGLNLVAQGFYARGLQNFEMYSLEPQNLTNNDTDWSYGMGLRIGWMGKVSDNVTLGATYQSPTWMSEFDDYAGLFAQEGDFDIPANFGAGITVQATPKLLITGDIVRIQYSDVDSIANPLSNLYKCGYDPSYCVGGDNGPGFGWEDMTVYKIGFEYQLDPKWVLRAGYNYGEAPIPDSETLFNILAPATVESHLTLGATWTLDNDMEITAAYMHAFENTIDGKDSIPPGNPPAGFGGGEADISMYQDSLGIAVSWKL